MRRCAVPAVGESVHIRVNFQQVSRPFARCSTLRAAGGLLSTSWIMSQLRKALDKNRPREAVVAAGAIAGVAEITATYPLDTIKTMMQA
jgi:hypothetical protein